MTVILAEAEAVDDDEEVEVAVEAAVILGEELALIDIEAEAVEEDEEVAVGVIEGSGSTAST